MQVIKHTEFLYAHVNMSNQRYTYIFRITMIKYDIIVLRDLQIGNDALIL